MATMASLLHIPTTAPLFNLRAHNPQNGKFSFRGARGLVVKAVAYKVVIEHEGKKRELEVEADESILSKALELGMDVPHDCKLGVCMTCPAKLLSGEVDQSEGMLSEDVIEWICIAMCGLSKIRLFN